MQTNARRDYRADDLLTPGIVGRLLTAIWRRAGLGRQRLFADEPGSWRPALLPGQM